MDIIKHNLKLNNDSFCFFAPENDSVVPGTVAGLQKNNWHLDKIDFKDGDYFIDIGASVGILSMFVAKLFPSVKILCFDANPVAIQCLRRGTIENSMSNITSFNLAVGPENKKDVKFLTYNENESCLIEESLCTNERNTSYTCDMISIEDIFNNPNHPIPKVKLLKVDIETGEFALFDHLFDKRSDILDRVEHLRVEIHPFSEENPPSKMLKEKLVNKFGDKVFF